MAHSVAKLGALFFPPALDLGEPRKYINAF